MTIIASYVIMSLLIYLCISEKKVTVHIIPHSHMDYGWVQTIDEYYYGNVIKIYNTIIKSLINNDQRTFVISDIAFFQQWYQSQSEATKELLKLYSKEGRIEFVGGGLVMNDEATSYYRDIINQVSLGLNFIQQEFDIKPKIGWSLDAFGHSMTNAFILEKYGYTHAVYDRISFDELIQRKKDGNLEFEWVLSNDKTIFISMLYINYNLSQVLPLVLDERNRKLRKKDISRSAKDLIYMLSIALEGLNHNHIMVLFGDDFSFWKGETLYKKMEQIMSYINTKKIFNDQEYELIYSTPSRYYQAIEKEIKVYKPNNIVRYRDFLPYGSDSNTYWTGFYTTRPYLKNLIKEASNLLQISTQLLLEISLVDDKALNNQSYVVALSQLRKTVGVMQHHDAITGTCKSRIANDYIKKIMNDINIVNKILVKETKRYLDLNHEDIKICLSNHYNNKKDCDQAFIFNNIINGTNLIIFNPSINDTMLIQIEFTPKGHDYEYAIYNHMKQSIPNDYFCINSKTFKYKESCSLYFYYKFNKKVSFIFLSIQLTNIKAKKPDLIPKYFEESFISNKGIINKVAYDPKNNSLHFQMNHTIHRKFDISLLHGYYPGEDGSKYSAYIKTNDGSYAFSPSQLTPIIFTTNPKESFIYKGKISTVVIIRFEYSYMLIYIFYTPFLIKVEHIIDPYVSKSKGINFAFIVRTNINNSINTSETLLKKQLTEFWTDSNGLQMIRRIKVNELDKTKKIVANNFYPVTSAISIRNICNRNMTYYNDSDNPYYQLDHNDRIMTIYNDRSQSGGVNDNGEIILLLNRHSSKDDGLGLNEPLYEKESSSEYFKLQHLIMLNMDNNNNAEGHKASFSYNYFNNPPLIIASFKGTEKSKEYLSLLGNMIDYSYNIRVAYYIINKNIVKLLVYCDSDPYYEIVANEGTIIFHLNNTQWVIKQDLKNMTSIQALNTNFNYKSNNDDKYREKMYTLQPNDLEVFILSFNHNN